MADGGYVVTWTEIVTDNASLAADIRAQVFNAAGRKVGGIITVNLLRTDAQDEQAVAGLSDGTFVIVYESTTLGVGTHIHMQRFDANGARIGGEVKVNATHASNILPRRCRPGRRWVSGILALGR